MQLLWPLSCLRESGAPWEEQHGSKGSRGSCFTAAVAAVPSRVCPGEAREMENSTHSDIRLSFGRFMFQVAVLWAALSALSPSHLDQECPNGGFIRPGY